MISHNHRQLNLQQTNRCVSETRQTTQIYEGTNQIQRIVMARQLLK